MYHEENIVSNIFVNPNGAIKVLVIVFIFVERGKAKPFFPFFTDGKNSDSNVLDLSSQGKRMQVLRLTKFFSKDDLLHGTGMSSKIRKKVRRKFLSVAIKKPPEESRGLKYSHEKQKM
jgi:hypothetical protein